jgi:predicted PurR-regulated permease PerM
MIFLKSNFIYFIAFILIGYFNILISSPASANPPTNQSQTTNAALAKQITDAANSIANSANSIANSANQITSSTQHIEDLNKEVRRLSEAIRIDNGSNELLRNIILTISTFIITLFGFIAINISKLINQHTSMKSEISTYKQSIELTMENFGQKITSAMENFGQKMASSMEKVDRSSKDMMEKFEQNSVNKRIEHALNCIVHIMQNSPYNPSNAFDGWPSSESVNNIAEALLIAEDDEKTPKKNTVNN